MTTPINTLQDIVDALEREPTLRRQLREYILTRRSSNRRLLSVSPSPAILH